MNLTKKGMLLISLLLILFSSGCTQVQPSQEEGNIIDTLFSPNSQFEGDNTYQLPLDGKWKNRNCVVPTAGIIITEDTTFCPGEYILELEPDGSGVIIDGSANITLEGDDTTLIGTRTYWRKGILVNDGENIKIKNLILKNFDTGIYINYTNDLKIEEVRIYDSDVGVDLRYSNEIYIINNDIYNSENRAILTTESPNFHIVNNKLINNTRYGMYLSHSDGGEILSNYVSGGWTGLRLQHSDDGYIYSNRLEEGITINGASNNRFEKNQVINSGWGSIAFIGISDNNSFKYNNILMEYWSNDNDGAIVYLDGALTNSSFNYNNFYVSLDSFQDPKSFFFYLDWDEFDINATNNYWSTIDISEISERIYDYYDDPSLGIVYFEPILLSPYVPPTPNKKPRVYPAVA